MPSDFLAGLAQSHPILVNIAAFLWFAGSFVSHVIRYRFPEESQRSNNVKTVAAIADACTLTFLTQAKAAGRAAGN